MNDSIGYLCLFTVPDLTAPYADLAALASQAGYPAEFVPTPPAPRHIWERATNVGSRGVKLDPPADLVQRVRQDYNTEPVVRVITRRVCNEAPVLKRHLVREAIIPLADKASKQLSLETVAVMTFDVTTNKADTLMIPDGQGWINGNIRQVIADIDAEITRLMTHANGQDVRVGIRDLLEQVYRVPMRQSGGAYFIPHTAPGAKDKLKALRSYVRGLDQWKTGDKSPDCLIFTVQDDEVFEMRTDILTSAVDEFKAQLSSLSEKVEPVLSGRAKGKVADGINHQAMIALLTIKGGIAAYRQALDDDLNVLDLMLQMAEAAVLKAAGQS